MQKEEKGGIPTQIQSSIQLLSPPIHISIIPPSHLAPNDFFFFLDSLLLRTRNMCSSFSVGNCLVDELNSVVAVPDNSLFVTTGLAN